MLVPVLALCLGFGVYAWECIKRLFKNLGSHMTHGYVLVHMALPALLLYLLWCVIGAAGGGCVEMPAICSRYFEALGSNTSFGSATVAFIIIICKLWYCKSPIDLGCKTLHYILC